MITAFDIGGSAIKSASVADRDNIAPLRNAPTPLNDFGAFVTVMREMIADAPLTTKGVAVSITGVVDRTTGLTKVANIPCTDQRTLEQDLRNELNLPVWVANDADCFALAEAELGAGRGHSNVFGIILGTGIGGGVVLDGELLVGAGGYAGEWGHGPSVSTSTPLWPHPIPHFPCGCGQLGCADAVGGARGMEKLHAHLHGENLQSIDITTKWLAGNAQATATINVLVDLISGPLATVLNVIGSSIVPVGGGLSRAPELISLLDTSTRKKMLYHPNDPIIVPGQCTIEPGLAGAAMLGLSKLST